MPDLGPVPPWRDEPDRMGGGDLAAATIANLKWIANAPKFESVAIGTDGLPVPFACADPGAFAMYKLNMGTNDPTRGPVKRRRDSQQAEAVARMISAYMPAFDFSPEEWKCFPAGIVEQGSEVFDLLFE